jgi:hypothetical protein
MTPADVSTPRALAEELALSTTAGSIYHALALLASVIKSGESWSPTCMAALGDARDSVERLVAAVREGAELRALLKRCACAGGAEPVRYGQWLHECAGGLAYFDMALRETLPGRTFDESLDATLAAYRAATLSPETTTA